MVSRLCSNIFCQSSVLIGLTKEAATVGTPENNSFEKQSPGFVPNYLQHPAWPYYDVQKNLEKLPDPDAHTVTTTAVPTYTDGEKRLPETIGDSLAKEMDQLHLLTTEKTSSSCKCGQNRPHPSPLLVKVRVSGSGESDFVEVEVAPPTYPALVSACCEELELSPSDVAKIRKLPSVLVRKDRDVQRMADGQELEVVLKGEGSIGGSLMSVISPPAVAASYPTTSVLTVNPFAPPTTAVLALSSQGVHMQRGSPVATAAMVTTEGLVTLKSDENGAGTSNHISGMTSDSGEVQNHTHSHTHQPGIVNGLQ